MGARWACRSDVKGGELNELNAFGVYAGIGFPQIRFLPLRSPFAPLKLWKLSKLRQKMDSAP